MLQQILGPLEEKVDALRLRVEVIDDRTLPKPQTHFALSATSLLPPRRPWRRPPRRMRPSPPPVGTADPLKGGRSPPPAPKGLTGRSNPKTSHINPIKILSGRWAKGVEKTGNYVYNITGKIPMEWILQFSKFLLQPFPGGTLIPAEGWCWAQLREVLVHDDDDTVRTEESLFEELPATWSSTASHSSKDHTGNGTS
ncbi:hypothetical protein EDB84DRAFT_1562338 [Lactarius hengduanensis]|nr:hypothetical protein EDB84DRAFT_1562338 [Lactarius hengduanensis]